MSITIINYIDQNLVDQVNAQALLRKEEAAASQAATDFASVLDSASISYSPASTPTVCSSSLDSIFTEAANTYGVSAELLKSIARAESNFSATATSSAGACGIMQLMPETAASLGVSNIYDVRENIMGGAQYISSLLAKYSGNTALALAAYNAGSSAVDSYGGIPPYAETQNYVSKVLSYLSGSFEVSDADSDESTSSLATASDTATDTNVASDVAAVETTSDSTSTTEVASTETETAELIEALLKLRNANPDTLDLLVSILQKRAN